MERVFVLPDPGEGLKEAEIVRWLVAEGDQVELNQPIVEVETAKAAVEIPSPYEGQIAKLHGAEGDTVRVGARPVTFEVADVEASDTAAPAGRALATPAVRKLAKEHGLDLSEIMGSGPGGRVTAVDVERESGDAGRAPFAANPVPISPVRRGIAERLTAVAAIPQVTTFRTVDCSELDAFREELGVSPLPVFVAALAKICADHRMLNASWTEKRILLHQAVHVGVAVDTEQGLLVPVVPDAQALGISAIAAEIARLADASRAGRLAPQDLSGSTISVSNTGSYGSEFGTPLLNPGNAVTVALGAIAPRALVVDGEVVARPACTLSLTFDHRVLDGAAVGRAFTDLVNLLQDNARLGDLPR